MKLTGRDYREGEEHLLVALWQRTYGQLGGYTTRSVEHWRWAVLARPGVTAADIRVVESEGSVVAYGVLGPGGQVLELAVDPRESERNRQRALEVLLLGLEQQARRHDYDTLTCAAPLTDRFLARAMARAGYHTDEGVFASLGIVDPLEAIRRLLVHRHSQLKGWQQRFVLVLAPGYYRQLPQTRLLIALGEQPTVSDASDAPGIDADCHIATDLTVLTDILFGSIPAARCLASGSVAVSPPELEAEALRLLETLSVRTTWQVPTSDVF